MSLMSTDANLHAGTHRPRVLLELGPEHGGNDGDTVEPRGFEALLAAAGERRRIGPGSAEEVKRPRRAPTLRHGGRFEQTQPGIDGRGIRRRHVRGRRRPWPAHIGPGLHSTPTLDLEDGDGSGVPTAASRLQQDDLRQGQPVPLRHAKRRPRRRRSQGPAGCLPPPRRPGDSDGRGSRPHSRRQARPSAAHTPRRPRTCSSGRPTSWRSITSRSQPSKTSGRGRRLDASSP